MRFTADDLARLTAADPAKAFPPSPEQRIIIEADPQQSMKVTAGAGSGKTTVISQRVVWLVANDYVAPEQILGLTFTRKAVGELGGRIRVLLARLRHNLGMATDLRLPGLDNPTVSTYNSYAASIVSEHGASIGIEPETVLLDDAAAHTIAGQIIDATAPGDIPGNFSRETMIADIIALAGAMNDHGRDLDEVTDYLEQCLQALVSSKGKPVDPSGRRAKLEAKIRTARLADSYMAAKRRNLAMDFSDQVRFAQRIIDEVPAAAEAERARWSIVLLDEFQDTSVAQLGLLRDLFATTAVTAVGDPRQAIYGWRGASADNMDRFSTDFREVESLTLSTSWRNDRAILVAANRIAAGLTDSSETPLSARDGAGEGEVSIDVSSGAHDPDYLSVGLRSLTEWVAELPAGTTKAVLCRKRAHFAPVSAALEAAGFAVHVHGSSGLLNDPFVADLRAVLTSAVDPMAGDSLMRLISGRMGGLGASDIAALNSFTRRQSDRRLAELGAGQGEVVAEAIDQPTIVEGLDELIDAAWAIEQGAKTSRERNLTVDLRESGLSDIARERLTALARALRAVRSGSGTISSIIRRAMTETGIDSDIWGLNDALRRLHRSSIDAFLSAASQYSATVDRPSVPGFLEWLSIMEAQDALSVAEPNASEDAINIMTVHASKGLEFDAVAVPSLVVKDFPTEPRDKEGWMERTALPYPLRGDRDHLVDFDLREAAFDTKKALDEWINEFIRPKIADAHEAEERRLAYVAFTRAKRHLWLGAELMGSRSTPDELSPFLTEAVEALGMDIEIPEPAEESEEDRIETSQWPVPRTHQVSAARRAGEWVRTAPEIELAELAEVPGTVGRYAAQAMRIGSRPGIASDGSVPDRLSATALVSWRRDPEGFLTQTLRPIPSPPSRAAEIGTTFHSWVEHHFGQASIDVEEDERVRPIDQVTIERLEETFLSSEFAARSADHVEMSFELVLGRFRVPGKIDAVFITDEHAEVVDWKTSKKPADDVLEVMKWQLALYRFAIQRAHPEISEVTGTFYFVGSDEIVRFSDLPEEAEIIAWLEANEAD
ncbi:UvrD-helicase domain-containing protein [Brevibacterium sp. GP-SGM9]|uniref:ATP-dependent DNA helicase n=1 Tax=unclassified Brevibacterium TaxID=2614124 RepID=UPI001E300DE8|nr:MULTISPECIES: ATP-dependent DNA helicase [unclassified Brevibacterium]MCD1284615.1 DNA helicase UvrD [Brevibacterium sp. CCUG 69071]MDK8435767.1 ATP-dependent DNA helicase [Brevibacterium sp. H-BE7]